MCPENRSLRTCEGIGLTANWTGESPVQYLIFHTTEGAVPILQKRNGGTDENLCANGRDQVLGNDVVGKLWICAVGRRHYFGVGPARTGRVGEVLLEEKYLIKPPRAKRFSERRTCITNASLQSESEWSWQLLEYRIPAYRCGFRHTSSVQQRMGDLLFVGYNNAYVIFNNDIMGPCL